MVQYGGYVVSNDRQYYYARKRLDETPLAYLHRLNGAAIRSKFAIRERRHNSPREHVEHFISTLDDRDLAKQLTLLRLSDAYKGKNFACVSADGKPVHEGVDGTGQVSSAIEISC